MPSPDDWQREMERYLAHFARSGKRPTILFTEHPQLTPTWTPALDMYETENAVVVLLDLAGIDPNTTDIQAEANHLVIRGVRRERHAGSSTERSYHALEIPYGRFERSLPLPAGLDTAAASASYRDGLLEITLPKRAPSQVRIAVEQPDRASDPGRR